MDKFLSNLWTKQILKQTDRQTLKCRIVAILTMIPPGKQKFSNKKNMKIGPLVQKLWLNIP